MTAPFGLILAGGQGRRLGGVDKSFLVLHERPMIAHAIERLSGQTRRLAVSAAGDAARFAAFGLDVLDDAAHRGKGPLAGLMAGFAWADDHGADSLLTVPVDTPFAPRDLAARLAPAPSVASHGGRIHHLVALWPVAARGALGDFLDGPGPYRVGDFARAIGVRPVAFAGQPDPFLNINTREDLAAAERRTC